jgi:hypothetical protein
MWGSFEEYNLQPGFSNTAMVPKKNGGQRMCIYFTLLYKACPKDYYPLPRNNILLDVTT